MFSLISCFWFVVDVLFLGFINLILLVLLLFWLNAALLCGMEEQRKKWGKGSVALLCGKKKGKIDFSSRYVKGSVVLCENVVQDYFFLHFFGCFKKNAFLSLCHPPTPLSLCYFFYFTCIFLIGIDRNVCVCGLACV